MDDTIQALQDVPLLQQECLEDAANDVRIGCRSLHVALTALIAEFGEGVWRVRDSLVAAHHMFHEACAAVMACGLTEERYLTHIEDELRNIREQLADYGVSAE
ncbi:MAG: hypothetical protein PHS73_01700 [Candidatus Peribacteraceae bacterium]|nr:hypothetical protein [Candidatus Peribacteraceae bacterium]